MTAPRWREKVETGLYRAHGTACASSSDHRARRRCSCPWQFHAPALGRPGMRLVTFAGTITEAREERARLRVERPTTALALPDPGTLREHVAAAFTAHAGTWSANTIRIREDDFRLWIGPTLGSLATDAVGREQVEVWLAQMIEKGASRRAIGSAVATLRVFLGVAVEWGKLDTNPAKRLRLPRPDPSEVVAAQRVLTAEQLASLFEHAGTVRTETMLRAAGEAGLRRGEIAGLRWGDVNLAAQRLDVRRQSVQERLGTGKGHRKTITAPKGGRSRLVALSATTAAKLGEWFEVSVVKGGAPADGYVWPGGDGEPMHDRSLHRALERACRRIALGETYIAQTKKGPQERFRALVTPHGLRHTAASLMLLDRVPLTVVAAQLGHADPSITSRIYAHLTSDLDLDLAAAVFDRGAGYSGNLNPTESVPPSVPPTAAIAENAV